MILKTGYLNELVWRLLPRQQVQGHKTKDKMEVFTFQVEVGNYEKVCWVVFHRIPLLFLSYFLPIHISNKHSIGPSTHNTLRDLVHQYPGEVCFYHHVFVVKLWIFVSSIFILYNSVFSFIDFLWVLQEYSTNTVLPFFSWIFLSHCCCQ